MSRKFKVVHKQYWRNMFLNEIWIYPLKEIVWCWVEDRSIASAQPLRMIVSRNAAVDISDIGADVDLWSVVAAQGCREIINPRYNLAPRHVGLYMTMLRSWIRNVSQQEASGDLLKQEIYGHISAERNNTCSIILAILQFVHDNLWNSVQ